MCFNVSFPPCYSFKSLWLIIYLWVTEGNWFDSPLIRSRTGRVCTSPPTSQSQSSPQWMSLLPSLVVSAEKFSESLIPSMSPQIQQGTVAEYCSFRGFNDEHWSFLQGNMLHWPDEHLVWPEESSGGHKQQAVLWDPEYSRYIWPQWLRPPSLLHDCQGTSGNQKWNYEEWKKWHFICKKWAHLHSYYSFIVWISLWFL